MPLVTIEKQNSVAILRLNNGTPNAIGPPMLEAFETALNTGNDPWAGLVLAGNTKFFSMGFDLPHLLKLDRSAMADFFDRFNAICIRLLTLPIPTACAIAGHAVAGGFILALTCDFRICGDGRQKVGLNEVPLGVPVPYLADLMFRQIAGDRTATAMGYAGTLIDVAQAHQKGIVDSTHPTETVETAAVQAIRTLADLPASALAATKAHRVATIAEQYARQRREKNEAFLDCWFNPDTQALLEAAARKF